jgi:hypothetical protein
MVSKARKEARRKRDRERNRSKCDVNCCPFCFQNIQEQYGQDYTSLKDHIKQDHPYQFEKISVHPEHLDKGTKNSIYCPSCPKEFTNSFVKPDHRLIEHLKWVHGYPLSNTERFTIRKSESNPQNCRDEAISYKSKIKTKLTPPAVRLQSILAFMKQRKKQEQIQNFPVPHHLGSLITQNLFDEGTKDASPSCCPYCSRNFTQISHFRGTSIRIHCLKAHPKETYQDKRDSENGESPTKHLSPPPYL